MNKDLLSDRFGRFWELPLALRQLGHDVRGICLSYKRKEEHITFDLPASDSLSVPWLSFNAGIFKLNLFSYLKKILRIAKDFQPDVVLTFSDSIYAIVGEFVANSINARLVIDMYDNFETYASMRVPFVPFFFYRACSRADGVTVISSPLAEYVQKQKRYNVRKVKVIVNGIVKELFYPRDKYDCRRQLGLPASGLLAGMTGAIAQSRGVDVIFRGLDALLSEFPNLCFCFAGQIGKGIKMPDHPRVRYLGNLSQYQIPLVLGALDLAVIPNKNSLFGRFCFPQKLYECIACGTPLVAANVGATKQLLSEGYSRQLFSPGDVSDFVAAVRRQLAHPRKVELSCPGWRDLGRDLECFLKKV